MSSGRRVFLSLVKCFTESLLHVFCVGIPVVFSEFAADSAGQPETGNETVQGHIITEL